MAAKKTSKKSISVHGTKLGVIVVGASPSQVRKGLALLAKKSCNSSESRESIKQALKFYDVAQRFFKQGGRFKAPYTHKKKAD